MIINRHHIITGPIRENDPLIAFFTNELMEKKQTQEAIKKRTSSAHLSDTGIVTKPNE